MKLLVLSILIGTTLFTAHAQQFQYKYYTEKDGLSNNSVATLLVDREGFLWAGTAFGLNRFDGNSFEKFYNDPSDTTSIADNNIQKIFLDRSNRLWIGTNAGISLYHSPSHTFTNFSPDTTVLPQPGISFQALCDDEQGNLWVGAKNDLLVFDPIRKKFSSSGWARYAAGVAPVNGNHLRVIVLGIIPRGHDDLWVLTTYGLFSIQTRTKEIHYYPFPGILDYHGCELSYADDKGNVWISTYYGGMLRFNDRAGSWTQYHTPPEFSSGDITHSIQQYAGDTLMYCATNTALLFDSKAEKVISKISESHPAGNSSAETGCNTIIRYHDLLWLGTVGGLVKIMPFNSLFHFTPLADNKNIERVFKPAGYEGVLFTTAEPNYPAFLKTKDNKPEPILISSGSVLNSKYLYLNSAGSGHSYLNNDEHFFQYDLITNRATPVALPPKSNPANDFDIRNMIVDRNGTIWVRALSQGLMKYDATTNKLTMVTDIPLNDNKELNALYYDSLTNKLWIAEEFNGVFVYDIGNKQTKHFGLNKPGSQRSAAIINISGDGNGDVWLCDIQAGLVKYTNSTQTFTRYTINDGLPSNNCYQGVYAQHGVFWFSTDNGLCKYDPGLKKFTSYSENEGFAVLPGVFLSSDPNGNIYMPYKNGYYSWNSDFLKDPVKTGSIYLRDIVLFNRHLPEDTVYSFSHGENNIRVLFGLLSFDNRDKVILEYSLNGSSWLSTDIHSYISFVNLGPGKYDLLVRIKNESIPGMHILFVIARPFWQMGWFLVLIGVAIIIAIMLLIRIRLNSIRKETSLRQRAMESEMSALRSQMNPHFIFNTLNSINSYIIENKKDEASDYLSDFSRLMRIILDHSQKRTVPLSEELNALKLYLELESRRLEASFDYNISIHADVDAAFVFIPPLIIQPFVENAIWHGLRGKKTGGHIEISVQKQEEGLLIEIQDDGIGRVASHKTQKVKNGNSFGTAATMQRILLNDPASKVEIEDLYNRDGQAMGTRVTIYLHHTIL